MTAICSGVLTTRGDASRVVTLPRPPQRTPFDLRGGLSPYAVARTAERRLPPTPALGRNFFRYLPESPCESPSVAHVIGLGRSEVRAGECYPPRNHPKLYSYEWRAGRMLPEHQLLLLTGASGEFESEATGRVRLAGDVMLFLLPGVWHRYRPLAGGGWTERWISLHGEPIRERLEAAGVTPHNAIHALEQPERLCGWFDLLAESVVEPTSARRGGSMQLAQRLLEEALRQSTDVQLSAEEYMAPSEEPVDDEIVRRALEIIWNHEHSPPLGVSDVARQLPVTRRTLDRRFSEALGRTVLDEINACRLARAKRLLAETDAPIKAVAYLAGFPSRERLRLAFLNHEGMPPSDYREASRRLRSESGV